MNFSCLIASCVLASLDIVCEPSSNALKVGDVSSVPLLPSFIYALLISSKSL